MGPRADSGRMLVGWALGPRVRGARAWSLRRGVRLEQRNLISHSSQACQPVPAHLAIHIQAAFSCVRRVTYAVPYICVVHARTQGSRRADTIAGATGLKRVPPSHSHISGERATYVGRSAHPAMDIRRQCLYEKKASKGPPSLLHTLGLLVCVASPASTLPVRPLVFAHMNTRRDGWGIL